MAFPSNNILKNSLRIALMCAFAAAIAACNQDPCEKDGNCGEGNCKTQDGEKVCECSPGYEADAGGICTVKWRDKFVGTYICTETQFNGTDTIRPTPYEVSVITGASNTSIIFVGVGANSDCNSSRRATAKLLSGKEFELLTPQSYCAGDPDLSATSIQGTGSINGTEITLKYIYSFTLSSNAISYECSAKLKRK